MVNGWTNLRLPIGVVIPTRNSMAYLPEHVAGMRAWVDLVREMVLVDSFSADGTVDYVRQHLRHPRLRVLTHPPGLYASWNHGIAHVTSPYTYVATLGDTASRTGLQHLFSVTGQLHCDVCLIVAVPGIGYGRQAFGFRTGGFLYQPRGLAFALRASVDPPGAAPPGLV